MDATPFTLDVAGWVNSPPIELEDLRGSVVLVEAFQMLCPGCVTSGIPQAVRVHHAFSSRGVVVVGLHTVFEHHEVMGREALAAFVSEYRIPFPVAIDRPVEGRTIPSTMGRYELQGTPTTLLVDRAGRLRHRSLGTLDDLALGALLGELLAEAGPGSVRGTSPGENADPDRTCRPGEGCT